MLKITLMDYNQDKFEEKAVKDLKECFHFKHTSTVTWINISGLKNYSQIKELAEYFGIHSLIVDDILSRKQRAKMEHFDNYVFFSLPMLKYSPKGHTIAIDRLSIILGRNFLVTFIDDPEDDFKLIRDWIRTNKGVIRKKGAAFLAYSIIDSVIDHYYNILEELGDHIEALEASIVSNPTPKVLHTLNNLKRGSINMRRSIWPVREVISNMERAESPLMKEITRLYMRDLYDHSAQAIDTVETYRDILSGLLDIYLSSISNRLNEVMKVLTIIATIFIPLTFITGIYGMNFRFMPEIEWRYGYFVVIGIMLLISLGMIFYFKKKKWV